MTPVGQSKMDTLVTTGWLIQHLDDLDLVVLDCPVRTLMDGDSGFRNMSGRADYENGHIPGASNISATELLDEEGRYRPHDDLVAMHEGDRSARTITYCGGGIAASSNAFIMTRLGFTDVAVYTASLQEWSADPANPLVGETS